MALTDTAVLPAPPSAREEAWRFTPLSRIRLDEDATGKVVVEHAAAPEVSVTTLDRDDSRLGSVLTQPDYYAARAMAGFERGTLVTVPRATTASGPTVITVRGEGGTAYGHLLVDVEAEAEATVVLDHHGTGAFVANAEYRVGDGARLTVVSLQDWDDDAVHLGAHAAEVGRDAQFRSVIVTLGGDVVRLAPTVRFAGPGGDAQLLGLVFADAGQHLEHRLFVDHQQPHCRSRVNYKVALQGQD
ncbi:MAG: SufD family Fe-S cluster assembly protein, partial [Frankia sp.]|nr:SufD family Fe-S cluster assembly protein [Frankia sp.]